MKKLVKIIIFIIISLCVEIFIFNYRVLKSILAKDNATIVYNDGLYSEDGNIYTILADSKAQILIENGQDNIYTLKITCNKIVSNYDLDDVMFNLYTINDSKEIEWIDYVDIKQGESYQYIDMVETNSKSMMLNISSPAYDQFAFSFEVNGTKSMEFNYIRFILLFIFLYLFDYIYQKNK